MSSSYAAASHETVSVGGGHYSGGEHGGHVPSYLNNPWRPYQLWQRVTYPKQFWYFVGSGLFCLFLCNLAYILRVHRRKNALMKVMRDTKCHTDSEKNTTYKSQPASWRRLPLAIDAIFKIVAFRWTVPFGRNQVLSGAELFFTLGYLAAALIWLLICSHGGEETFWAQRAGGLGFKQIPLLALLAGKNNLITLVTGISYEKINIMHRAVGRTLFILIMMHCFTKLPFSSITEVKYYAGVMSAVAFGVIFLTSLRPVRTHAFELFLVLHIFLVAIFLAGAYFHQPKSDDTLFIWLFIGFWLFDRVSRGVHLFVISRGKKEAHEAIVEVLCHDSLRLTLPNRHINWTAGQHVFLVLPGVSNIPFEAHPFTIANIPKRDDNGIRRPTDLIFYIRAMDGFTRKLYNYAASHNGDTVTALVDGPYGRPPAVNSFSTVVLLAGGSGASFTVPLLLDIIYAARRQKTPVKRVAFIWTVRHKDDLKWALQVLSHACTDTPHNLHLDIRLHVTRAEGLVSPLIDVTDKRPQTSHIDNLSPLSPADKHEPLEASLKGSQDEMTTSIEVSTMEGHSISRRKDYLKIHLGRPNIPTIVQEEIETSSGPVSVNACGPAALTKAVRSSLRSGAASPSALIHGGVPVSMYVENFGATRAGR